MSYTHPNYIKASNITLISILVGLIAIFFNHDKLVDTRTIGGAVFTFILLLLLAFLIRMGYAWMKYVLLVFLLFGLIVISKYVSDLINNTLTGVIEVVQSLLQLWVVVLLFRVPKQTYTNNQPNSQQ